MRLGLTIAALALVPSLSVAPAQAAGGETEAAALAAFIETARDADVVLLGEIHGNPAHHRAQAAVVEALQPAAIVFEMIPQEHEAALNALREEGADRAALAEALDWDASGWPDFAFYAAIMDAAPRARVFGAGQPRADIERAMLEGAAGAFGPDASIYGLDAALEPEEQARREAEMAAAHCDALAAETLPGMVEAQRFREAGLADAALWARIITGEGQVAVIAGSGHLDRDRGVPAMIAVAAPETTVATLGQFEHPPGEDARFDAVVLAPPADRGDPCAGLDPPAD